MADCIPKVALLATEDLSPFHFSVPCIVFGARIAEQKLFELMVCAEQAGRIQSREGFSIDVMHGLEAMEKADIIVVPFWACPSRSPSRELVAALQHSATGSRLVGLCLGTYVLAYAGLLDGKEAATHWEWEEDFTSRFPSVQLNTNKLYIEDGNLITSAGTAAGLDCCLHLVRKYHGAAVANKVARKIVIAPHRDGGQSQFIERPVQTSTQDTRMNEVLRYMEENIQLPYDSSVLADKAGMSRRTFTRHFLHCTGVSPGKWLEAERLRRSQELLETTGHTVDAVAELCGFASPVTFRQRFKQRFGISPRTWRNNFRGE